MVCSSNRLIIPLTRGWVQAPPLKIVVCFGVCNLMIIQLLNSALERYHSFFNYPIYSLLTKSRYFTLPRRIIVGQLSSSAIESSWLSSSEKSVSSKQHVATVQIEFCSACVFVRSFDSKLRRILIQSLKSLRKKSWKIREFIYARIFSRIRMSSTLYCYVNAKKLLNKTTLSLTVVKEFVLV